MTACVMTTWFLRSRYLGESGPPLLPICPCVCRGRLTDFFLPFMPLYMVLVRLMEGIPRNHTCVGHLVRVCLVHRHASWRMIGNRAKLLILPAFSAVVVADTYFPGSYFWPLLQRCGPVPTFGFFLPIIPF